MVQAIYQALQSSASLGSCFWINPSGTSPEVASFTQQAQLLVEQLCIMQQHGVTGTGHVQHTLRQHTKHTHAAAWTAAKWLIYCSQSIAFHWICWIASDQASSRNRPN